MERRMIDPLYGIDDTQMHHAKDYFTSGEATTYGEENGCHDGEDAILVGFKGLCKTIGVPECQVSTLLEHVRQTEQWY